MGLVVISIDRGLTAREWNEADLERLSGIETSLRPVDPRDIPKLYEISTSERNGFRWRHRGSFPSLQQFEAELHRWAFQQLVVIAPESNEVIGHVVAYNHDVINSHCCVAVLMSEAAVGRRRGREALDLFVMHLFRSYPLRKIYAEVPGATVTGVEPSTVGDDTMQRFAIEGTLRRHWFIDGDYQDMVVVATYREAWANESGVSRSR